jgi:hypothetical protein
MLYVLYSSVGNSEGIDEYLAYSEIDEDGYWTRHLEIGSDGVALRYTTELAADFHGQLPEGRWDDVEASDKKYGTVAPITEALFNTLWCVTRCANADRN